MPERGARMPTRNGLFCAIAGPKTRPDADKAPMAAAETSSLRREITMVFLPGPAPGRSIYRLLRLSMIFQAHVSNKQAQLVAALGRDPGAKEIVDLRAGERPVVVEVRDHDLHEWLRERDSALPIAQVVVENGQRQLAGAFAFVRPFEAIFGEALDFIVLIERSAIDRHDQPVDGALSLIGLHGIRPILLRA